jgi:hypothetical protein
MDPFLSFSRLCPNAANVSFRTSRLHVGEIRNPEEHPPLPGSACTSLDPGPRPALQISLSPFTTFSPLRAPNIPLPLKGERLGEGVGRNLSSPPQNQLLPSPRGGVGGGGNKGARFRPGGAGGTRGFRQRDGDFSQAIRV